MSSTDRNEYADAFSGFARTWLRWQVYRFCERKGLPITHISDALGISKVDFQCRFLDDEAVTLRFIAGGCWAMGVEPEMSFAAMAVPMEDGE